MTTIFLVSTTLLTLVGVPWYALAFGVHPLHWVIFGVLFVFTGMSITVGYHRLFTHRAYSASWPVKLFTLLFGGAAFQMSALQWSSEHRYHHKYEDEDGDPHDPHGIHHGFLWAHMGWLFVHVDPVLEMGNVGDLRRDPLVMWQHRNYLAVSIACGFFLPMAVATAATSWLGGVWWVGLLGGFLIGACARIVAVHHITWFINSLAHTIGRRPYDSSSSSRDSALLALLTFGEGYHNYHHAFQTDYRNGVRFWQFDPSKWVIWTLSKIGLARDLRRIPAETIRMARIREKGRLLERRLEMAREGNELLETAQQMVQELEEKLEEMHLRCRRLLTQYSKEYSRRTNRRLERPRQQLEELKAELQQVRREFRATVKEWQAAHRLALTLALTA
ncbi:MAG: fatty acid desaturase [Acidobacteriota bacterium]